MRATYQNKNVEIMINDGCINNVHNFFKDGIRYLLIIDENVSRLHKNYFPEIEDVYVVKSGEQYKTIEEAMRIVKFMLEADFQRKDMIIALGGGVVGDLAGFVASIYKRGINYFNIPTTIISQVDSSIGGKVGVNFEGYKNQVGSIHHPEMIFVDPTLLRTLPEQEILSGFGEIVKYGALFDRQICNDILKERFDISWGIKRCIEFKVKLTEIDEFDTNKRQILNFGHTIGHAIEAKYHLPHGMAIGYGMYMESGNEELKKILQAVGFNFNFEFKGLYPYIAKDKKAHGNRITLVDLKDIGRAVLREGFLNEFINK